MPKPVAAVVELLTDALAEAKRGDITSVALVFVRPDGTVSPALAMGAGAAGDLYLAANLLAAEVIDEVRAGSAGLSVAEDELPKAPKKMKLVGDN